MKQAYTRALVENMDVDIKYWKDRIEFYRDETYLKRDQVLNELRSLENKINQLRRALSPETPHE